MVATGSLLMFWTYRLSYILDLCLIKMSILLCTYDTAYMGRVIFMILKSFATRTSYNTGSRKLRQSIQAYSRSASLSKQYTADIV